jgi:hypothetical protein
MKGDCEILAGMILYLFHLRSCGTDRRLQMGGQYLQIATPEQAGALLDRCPDCDTIVEPMTNPQSPINNQAPNPQLDIRSLGFDWSLIWS